MIGYLKGSILFKSEKTATIMTAGGVGYNIHLPSPLLSKMQKEDFQEFFIETIVREDSFTLFGFQTYEDRELFNMLIEVNKVGPKLALATLSFAPAENIVSAILTGDVKRLTLIPGLGKKTAEKIIIDLKDKVKNLPLSASLNITETHNVSRHEEEAENGLMALGYNKFMVKNILSKIKDKDKKQAEEIVREALKIINEQKK